MDTLNLTDNEIEELIHCPKNIVDPPRKEMQLVTGHWRNDMRLESIDREHDFSVFIRKDEDFEENFSIGLVYCPRGVRGDIHLFRCNGPHGPHILFDHHDRYHIHMADPKNLSSGLKAERTAHITREYASFQDALGYFLKTCNIVGANEYFKGIFQRDLPFPQDGEQP